MSVLCSLITLILCKICIINIDINVILCYNFHIFFLYKYFVRLLYQPAMLIEFL